MKRPVRDRKTYWIPTGDWYLDRLIDPDARGFCSNHESPISLLVRGAAGVGKSLFALQLASEYVKRNKALCVYFALEEQPRRVKQRLHTYFGGVAAFTLTSGDAKLGKSEEARAFCAEAAVKGGILICDSLETAERPKQRQLQLNLTALPTTLEYVSDVIDSVHGTAEHASAPDMLLVDSLNALMANTDFEKQGRPRKLLDDLLKLPSHKQATSLYVFEETGEIAVEDFLVDAVIELTRSGEEHGRRSIRIAKARDHACEPVAHELSIDDQGIHVRANLAVSPEKFAVRSLVDPINGPEKLGIPGIEEYLRLANESRQSTGIARGSSTLVVGDPGLHKHAAALQFLEIALRREETVGYVSLGRIDDATNGLFDSLLGRSDMQGWALVLEPGDMTPAGIVNEVMRRFSNGGAWTVRRIVFSDIDNLLEAHGPSESREVLATLCRALERAGVCSCFVQVLRRSGTREEVLLPEIFDNVICFRNLQHADMHRPFMAVTVQRLRGTSMSAPNLELRVDECTGRIDVERGVFRHLVELDEGEVGTGPTVVHYYLDNTDALSRLHETLEAMVKRGLPDAEKPQFQTFGNLPELPSASTVLRSVIATPPYARTETSDILLFDEYWGKRLIEEGRLLPLSDFAKELGFDRFLSGPYSLLQPVSREGQFFGVPFYVNLSVLAYRCDLLREHYVDLPRTQNVTGRKALSEKVDVETGVVTGDLNWDEVFEIARVVQRQLLGVVSSSEGKRGDGAALRTVPNRGFAVDAVCSECYGSFLLA